MWNNKRTALSWQLFEAYFYIGIFHWSNYVLYTYSTENTAKLFKIELLYNL